MEIASDTVILHVWCNVCTLLHAMQNHDRSKHAVVASAFRSMQSCATLCTFVCSIQFDLTLVIDEVELELVAWFVCVSLENKLCWTSPEGAAGFWLLTSICLVVASKRNRVARVVLTCARAFVCEVLENKLKLDVRGQNR